jgi:hypothetical protein
MLSDQQRENSNETLYVDISNLNLNKLKRISSELDINNIQCSDSSPIYDIDPSHKIVAIGDIHGDLTSLLIILFGAELINNNLEWVGENTFLVFTGDLLDNYRDKDNIVIKQHPADEITIISFLADLNQQALKTDGRVLLCLGNHELLNIVNNYYGYVSKPTINYFNQHLDSRKTQFSENSLLRQKLSCLFEPFILINNKYFFSHAGLTIQFIQDLYTNYRDKLNMRDKLIEFSRDIKNIVRGINNKKTNWIIKKHINNDDNSSFFWTRQYGVKNRGCEIFSEAARLLGLEDLILIKGHDYQDYGIIEESCNNNIYLIDTQISRSFLEKNETNNEKLISDNMNYLEIKYDKFSMINVKLTQPEIIYKEKIDEFNFYKSPEPKSLLSKVKDKTGLIISGISNAVYNVIPKNPYSRKVEHEDGTTYYDDNDVPHDAMGRVLFGGLKK